MKKRLLALLLASGMCLSLAACGGDEPAAESNAPTVESAAPVEEAGWKEGDTVYFHVPSKAGGGTDLFTRYLTAALTEACPGVNFVVNNYDTGEVGMEAVKNADPDGYNLGLYHGGGIVQYLSGSSNVSMKDDMKIVGVANLGGPQAIIAPPDAPFTNLVELGEYIETNPGDVVIGCSLGGTTQMIFVSLVDALTGDSTLANYVQCSAEADKLTQTASGSIDVANCSIPNALSYEADGKLTILGTIGPEISTLETMAELLGTELGEQYKSGPEQGIDTATWDSSYYVYVPKDTPDEVCEAINEAICAAHEVQSYIDGMNEMASFCAPLDYAATQETFTTEWNFMDALVTDMGLKVEGR